jgi:alanine racemase
LGYLISHIANILNAEAAISDDVPVEHLLFDSRKIYFPSTSIFFALKGVRQNGHHFIPELYKNGVRNFVISDEISSNDFPQANILKVKDVLTALQKLAAFRRLQFSFPVIGITGSNGKTIVKEWLYQLLHDKFNIVRSPKSYNSQIGVPVSVWQMNKQHELGIFEAGISQAGEMEKLNQVIYPTIGILTNIGEAHNEGFQNADQKAFEKIKLFEGAELVVYCCDDWLADKAIVMKLESGYHKTGKYPFRIFSWGRIQKSTLQILQIDKGQLETSIIALYKGVERKIIIPFTDEASIYNAITCWCILLYLEIGNELISEKMKLLQPVNMRLELKKGINHCTIINDSYSADLSSLHIALNFLQHQAGHLKKTVILSDFLQTGLSDKELYSQIYTDLQQHDINKVIAIGQNNSGNLKPGNNSSAKKIECSFFSSTEEFLKRFRFSDFRDEIILIKGARVFHFEQIIQLLEQKIHRTELEINLSAIAHNLKQYQQLLSPSTKIMAMVKAFSYGSGGAEIANKLQFLKIDYLGVAYADEGIELRKAGIHLPIMVMNTDASTFDAIVAHHLEPVIFSFTLLKEFDLFLKNEGITYFPVHLEIETGMHRLGFGTEEIKKLAAEIKSTNSFKIQSVFSHLAASEDQHQDEFTQQQYEHFSKAYGELHRVLGYTFIRHIANTAAILRHPEMQLDMVRLGIGLYGIDSAASDKINLLSAATLKSTIAQVKTIKKGETIGYNRKGNLEKDSIIATVNIGYADGYNRRFSNGVGFMLVKNHLAPVIGTVCMDMTMIDVTDIPDVKQGDEVIVFGKELSLQDLANWAGTIPYEIMTGISQRIKRVYYEE